MDSVEECLKFSIVFFNQLNNIVSACNIEHLLLSQSTCLKIKLVDTFTNMNRNKLEIFWLVK